MLWTHDETLAMIAKFRHVGLALPPPVLAAWHRDLASIGATIHTLVPAWWWRLMGSDIELGSRRAPNLGPRAAEPPTFVDIADADVLHLAGPFVRLVEGKGRAVELARLRTLDSLVGDLVHLDALVIGACDDAVAILSGAAGLLETLRPLLVLDLANRFGEAEHETDPNKVAVLLETCNYRVSQRPCAHLGRYLVAHHRGTPPPLLKDQAASPRLCSLKLPEVDARSSGWGPRPMLAVELPPRTRFVKFIVASLHSGDVRLYADLCGRFWFEATAPIADAGRLVFALPRLLPGSALARFRLTPVRGHTSGTPIPLHIKSLLLLE